MTAAIGGTLLAASLPGDPLGIDAAEPVWWWFPLTVVTGFNFNLLLVVAAFLALQWIWLNKPWQRAITRSDSDTQAG
jgi:hypothetical protein